MRLSSHTLHLAYDLTLMPRMYAKIRTMHGLVDCCCENLQKFKAEGVLDGYSDTLLDCLINTQPRHYMYLSRLACKHGPIITLPSSCAGHGITRPKPRPTQQLKS